MTPRTAVLVIVAALAAALAAWLVWGPEPDAKDAGDGGPGEAPAVLATDEPELQPGDVYFPGEDGRLHAAELEVPMADGEPRVRALVEALLAGPRQEGAGSGFLFSPWPEGTQLAGVFFMSPTQVALDLRLPKPETPGEEADDEASEAAPATLPARRTSIGRFGSMHELLTVYSLVNTVALGSGQVERVVLLIDGRQPETLAGHVDLTRPLGADPSWIAADSRPGARAAG